VHVVTCVLAAFDLCITLMDVGEVCLVVTDARFAYGTVGRLASCVQLFTFLREAHYSIHVQCVWKKRDQKYFVHD